MRRTLVVMFALVVSVVGLSPLAVASRTTTRPSSTAWVDQPVSFVVHGVRVFATFRHPVASTATVPGALLIAGSGSTNRNGNTSVAPGPLNTMEELADVLSGDGVASLRYDKLGSGQTGLGHYASAPSLIGIAPYEEEAGAALRFLAREPQVDPRHLAVVAHSEGALYALLLATGHAGPVPHVSAFALLEPLSVRLMDLLRVQVEGQIGAEVASGQLSAATGSVDDASLVAGIAQLRATGHLPSGLASGIAPLFSDPTVKYLYQADAFDPATLATALPRGTHVLVTCSNVDLQVSCGQVQHLLQGLRRGSATVTFVRLNDVNHGLHVDPTGNNYNIDLPYSPMVSASIARLVASAL